VSEPQKRVSENLVTRRRASSCQPSQLVKVRVGFRAGLTQNEKQTISQCSVPHLNVYFQGRYENDFCESAPLLRYQPQLSCYVIQFVDIVASVVLRKDYTQVL